MSTFSLQSAVKVTQRTMQAAQTRLLLGRIEKVTGSMITARMGGVSVGEMCHILTTSGKPVPAEVVGLDGVFAFLAPIGSVAGLSTSAGIRPTGTRMQVKVGTDLLGCLLDGLGQVVEPETRRSPLAFDIEVDRQPPDLLDRSMLTKPLALGLRAVDGLLTCAEGQRIGIFGAAGAGKSTLVSHIARHAEADVVVVALVGERGREVRDFMDQVLGGSTRARTVVVAATSDRPALERVKATQVATTIAEWFRDQGKRVVLVVDSLTRLARAWREIGLAAGEPPTRRGFPPSLFAMLPRLLERAASTQRGSLTAFYTILVEGDLASDPVAEEVKSVLDGHIVLSAALAEAEHYPAIDVLASRSRLMSAVVSPAHQKAAAKLRRLLARHAEIEFLLRVGEYRAGNDELADEALAKIDAINGFLRQPESDVTVFTETQRQLATLAA